MDALELLTADHNRVPGMFTRFQAAEGSNLKEEGPEAGRHPNQGTKGADRPYGGSTARGATGVDPQDPINEDMPNMPPGDQGG